MEGHFFLSYSKIDGLDFARALADRLLGTPPPIRVWLDERELQAEADWDEQIVEALRTCTGLLFLMTRDSVHSKSECKREWTRALRYKKPIIPLLVDAKAEMPYRLEPRQYLDFTRDQDQALATLRNHIRWRSSPQGLLQGLKERLSDAERDLPRAEVQDRARIDDEIGRLRAEATAQEQAITDPEGASRKTSARIESSFERERQPAKPVASERVCKVHQPSASDGAILFQDRHVETKLVGIFSKTRLYG